MARIFRKVHFWKDHRTYLEVDGSPPEIIKGFPKEGFVVVKIGEQSTVKSAFKLDVDEARALRDQLNTFLRIHDMNFTKILNTKTREDYTRYKRPYVEEKREPARDTSVQQPFFLFSEEKDKEMDEGREEKDESEFYF